MRLLVIGSGVFAAALTASAQDTTVKSTTRVDVDEGHVVSMTGCLRQGPSGTLMLHGTVAAAGEEVQTKTKVKTDVDDDETKVKARTRSKAEDDPVGTAGAVSAFTVVAGKKVNLASHVGQRVQLSAVVVDANHKDADVKVRNRTTVDPDDARDTTTRSTTKVEIDKALPGHYTVVAVTPLGGAC